MVFNLIPSVSPEELVDFEDQRHLFERMLDRSAEKRLMFVQAPGMCGKTSLLSMVRFHCERKNIPCCQIDFRGKSYDNPHFTLATEICDQLRLLPQSMVEALQPLSLNRPAAGQASTNIEGDVVNSYVITQVLMTVSLTPDDLHSSFMRDRLIRAFAKDLSDFAVRKGGIVCLFDSFEDISAEDETWLFNALLNRIAKGEIKGVTVVAAGRRWPKIEPFEWENHTYLINGLPLMSVEHIKIYAQKVGVEITDAEAEFSWRASNGGNPLFMGMLIKNLGALGKEKP